MPGATGKAKVWASKAGHWCNRYRYVLAVFGLALALRVLFVLALNSGAISVATSLTVPRLANDAFLYDALARSIASGHGYQYSGDYVAMSRIPPLFPLFLAGLYWIWGGRPSIVFVGLVNALLGALTVLLLYRLTKLCFTADEMGEEDGTRNFGERVGLAAALLFAIYPFEIFHTPYVLKESFSIFLTVGFALAWACMLSCARSRKSFGWALVAGAMGGLSALSRFPHIGLMLVFVVANLWLARRYRRPMLWQTGLALLVFSLIMLPWLVRNYYVLGHVALSNHGLSRYLYNGNSDLAEPESGGSYEARGPARSEHNKRVDAATEHDVYANELTYLRDAVRAIIYSPGHVLVLMASKLVNMWRPVWVGSTRRTWIVLGVPYLLMMMLALPGLVLARRHDAVDPHGMIVLYALILFYLVGHLIFYGMIRERQYVEPFLIVFAAYSLCLVRQWPGRSAPSIHQQ